MAAKSLIPKDRAQRGPSCRTALWPNSRSQLNYNSRMTNPSGKEPLVSAARYSEMGFIIPAAVLLGFFLGKLFDHWLHTRWLYLVGLLFGAVVGFTQMIRMAMSASKEK
jgi:F0F1-type ATP synthase assembly protein I